MLKNIGDLVKDIARDWAIVWNQPKTEEIFEHIFASLGNIFQFIGNIAEKVDEAWNHANNGLRILEAIRDFILEVWKGIDNITAEWARWAKEDLSFVPLFEALADLLGTIADKMQYVRKIAEDFNKTLVEPLVEHFIEVTLPNLLKVFDDFLKKINWEKLQKNLHLVWEALEHIGEVFLDGVVLAIERLANTVADFMNSGTFQDLVQKFHDWAMTLTAEDIADLIEKIFKALILFKGLSIVSKVIGDIANKLSFLGTIAKGVFGGINTLRELIGKLVGKKTIELETKGAEVATKEIGKVSTGMGGLLSKVGEYAKFVTGGLIIGVGLKVNFDSFTNQLKNGINWEDQGKMIGSAIAIGIGAVFLGANPAFAAIGVGVAVLVEEIALHFDEIKAVLEEKWNKCVEIINQNIVTPWKNWWETLKTDLDNFSWSDLGKQIVESIVDVFKKPYEFIKGALDNFFGSFWSTFCEVFGIGNQGKGKLYDLGIMIIQTIKDGFIENFDIFWQGLSDFFTKIGEWISGFVEDIGSFFDGIAEKLVGFGSGVAEVWDTTKTAVSDAWNTIKTTTAQMVQDAKQKIGEWINAGWEKITDKAENLRTGLEQKWDTIKSKTKDMVDDFKGKIADWASNKWDDLETNLREAVDLVAQKWDDVKNGFKTFRDNYMPQILEWADGVKDKASQGLENVRSEIEKKWGEVKKNFTDFADPYIQATKDWVANIFPNVKDAFENVKQEVVTRVDNMKKNFADFVKDFSEKKDTWLRGIREETPKAFNNMKEAIGKKWEDISREASEFFPKLGTDLYNFGKTLADKFGDGVGNMKSKVSGIVGELQKDITGAMDKIGDWISGAIKNIQTLKDSMNFNVSSSYTTKGYNVRAYATGGFPEDGLFFANHNELVGQFSNGKTAVANNEQIIAGIEQATYNAFLRASNDASSREEALLTELISAVKQGSKVSIDGREIVTAYDNRKARNGYAF
ncbi:MAG: hypothetical protein MJ236_00800 [Clostridia bacterium]|nr:hypothetical protein [Clostridia bacterium]